MIRSVLAVERAITQDMETRHLVHTDVLESVSETVYNPLSPRLHVCPRHGACAAQVWSKHLQKNRNGSHLN